ncbi:hypothetical protein [Herbaspirillum sp. alder98]|uniref:hypothetical protein n=1 Tax=Herbaspirillum sp. alder98 TaxID=2913096 RepID=UPI0039BD45A5
MSRHHLARAIWRTIALCLTLVAASAASAADNNLSLDGAAGLRTRYAQLQPQLQDNAFGRPLHLDSSEGSSTVKGDIYAVLEHPFTQVREALASPANWCDILILHLNTKYCSLSSQNGKTMLRMHVGKKTPQELRDTYRVDFVYAGGTAAADYFSSSMRADKGPLDTSDYRIQIEAVQLPDNRAFLHLSYSYAYGMAGKLALRAYLATVGRDKVGFTVTGQGSDGKPHYVTGSRASVERNTMRYYLAIDAYLASLSQPAAQRQEKRLDTWYATTEQYRTQLNEVDRNAYLAMKRDEVARQQLPAD